MKVIKYYRVIIRIDRVGTGYYRLIATYRGREIRVYTHDSMAYDRCDCDCLIDGMSYTAARKEMMDARRTLWTLIRREYNNQ